MRFLKTFGEIMSDGNQQLYSTLNTVDGKQISTHTVLSYIVPYKTFTPFQFKSSLHFSLFPLIDHLWWIHSKQVRDKVMSCSI